MSEREMHPLPIDGYAMGRGVIWQAGIYHLLNLLLGVSLCLDPLELPPET